MLRNCLAAKQQPQLQRTNFGAHDRDRTGDLILTKNALCLLSYTGISSAVTWNAEPICSDYLAFYTPH